MKTAIIAKIGLALLTIAAWIPAAKAANIIYATDDAYVKLGTNNAWGMQAIAYVGTDPGSTYQLYLKFALPSLTPGYEYGNATLYGYYHGDPIDSIDREFSWYLANNDGWTENSITGNNAPGYSGSALATWTPTGNHGAPGDYYFYNKWENLGDVASALNAETNGYLSLVLKQTDELLPSGVESFNTHEAGSNNRFYIAYTTQLKSTVNHQHFFFLALVWLVYSAFGRCFYKCYRYRGSDPMPLT
jgi:hypothetical protein